MMRKSKMADYFKDDKDALRDKCGVFGIYAPGKDVAKITYLALHSLQHRGQESAGITVSDGKTFRSIRKLGLVTSIFNEENLSKLKGFLAIGHNRYSTTGGNTIENVQPIIIPNGGDSLALSHNGNLVNSLELSKKLKKHKMVSTTDTEVLALLICQNEAKEWDEKISNAVIQAKGAYSIVACTKHKLYAFRDPWGFRPLVIGSINGNFVVASETCTLDTIGAKFVRDVALGEIISIDESGVKTVTILPKESKKFCLFEYVYLARPDSVMNNVLVHKARQRSGKILAKEAPVAADMVVAVPDSGTSAAIGFAQSTGIAYGEALIKNRYIGRTFIAPEQKIREQNVKMKFNPMKEVVMGKRIVIVDDSIVRGTTMKKIVDVLRSCGAKKIHLRICSPPIRWPCFFGVDTPERKQLIASRKSVSEIRKFIGADTLHYLSLSGLIKASGQPKDSLCSACFSGNYPMKVDLNFTKNIFESSC